MIDAHMPILDLLFWHSRQLMTEGKGANGKRNLKSCVKAFCGGKKKGTGGMPPNR